MTSLTGVDAANAGIGTGTGTGIGTRTDGAFGVVDLLLRDRSEFLDRIERGEDLPLIARTMLITIALCAAAFGASIGAYRGGAQIAYAALKLPLVVLLTAAISAPALTALSKVATGAGSMRRDLSLVLASLGFGSLVIAALAPIVLLALSLDADYHSLILLTVGCCAVGGAAGLVMFLRGIGRREGRGHLLAAAVVLGVFAMVGTQMAWTFRPYLVRPRSPDVTLIRAIEGSFLESVATSLDSSRGVYRRERAPLPGEETP